MLLAHQKAAANTAILILVKEMIEIAHKILDTLDIPPRLRR